MESLFSIVVPVYNSATNLQVLAERVSRAMDAARLHFELILVDDGSHDESFAEILRLSKQHRFIRGFRLSRNFGQQPAIFIGLQESRGDYVGILDDDCQDPPEILPDFFGRLTEEADVVYGIRRRPKEGLLIRFLYTSFYLLLHKFSYINIHLDAGDFCVMKRCVVDAMLRSQEANPFLRGIRSWVGFKQMGVEYQRDPRIHGKSGYSFRKYLRFALHGILAFSYLPLRLASYLGILTACIGFAFALYVVVLWMIKPFEVSGYASLIVVITFLGGVQLIAVGIIGEYLAKLNDNMRNWPVAIIAEKTSEDRY
jgi:dolichol-phosphate mannosyltransferase